MRKLSLLILGAAIGAGGATMVSQTSLLSGMSAVAASADTYRQLSLFGDVFEKVRTDYVEKPEEAKLVESAINGMLTSLDPHSSFMDAKSFRDMQVQTRGEFGGLGIEVTMEEGLVKVVTPIDETPASRAGILANEMSTSLVTTSGPAIERGGDLMGILTNLDDGDVLFIDEIHRLARVVEELLYPAMEDFAVNLVMDKGVHARSIKHRLSRFSQKPDYSNWLSAMATDMSPSTLIFPVMNAVVGLRSPATSDSRSSSASLMVQSAGASVVEIVAPSMTITPSVPVSNFTERSKPEPSTRAFIVSAIS